MQSETTVTLLPMLLVVAALLCTGWWLGTRPGPGTKIGAFLWALTPIYYAFEYAALRASQGTHDPLRQPQSDLGVTVCGVAPYPLTVEYICSPWFLLMNWGFLLSGTLIATGALCLRRTWPPRTSATVSTVAWIIFGLSTATSGLIPADIAFLPHTLLALPGMFAPVVALFALSSAVRDSDPRLARWTFSIGMAAVLTLALIPVSAVWAIPPGGLTQRLIYLVPHIWLTGVSLVLLRPRSKKAHHGPAESTT